MEEIYQRMVEVKKNKHANAFKKVKRLCKDFGFVAKMNSLTKRRREK